IIVQDKNKKDTIFIVSGTRLFGNTDDATEVFISEDGLSHLNLITCGGTWNKITKKYSKRLVVFADKQI
ncbi:MAG: class F sortase, partial [Candidatus Magasanikbacteria bacterium]